LNYAINATSLISGNGAHHSQRGADFSRERTLDAGKAALGFG
jgi:hypothetical protein